MIDGHTRSDKRPAFTPRPRACRGELVAAVPGQCPKEARSRRLGRDLGFALYSTALNWGRATLGVLPFIWLGGRWFGLKGVLAGYGLGVVLFGVLGMVLCFRVLGRLRDQSLRAGTGLQVAARSD